MKFVYAKMRMNKSTEYRFKKAFSSMRNSDGGALFVHTCRTRFGPVKDLLQSAVVPILGTMLTDDEIMSDGFRWHRVESGEGHVYKINVLQSDKFMTAYMKTKMPAWRVDNQVWASFEKLRPLLLYPRTVSMTEPTVQGLPHMNQAGVVKIYLDNGDAHDVYNFMHASQYSVSAWVNHIINGCSLPEYVTSVSKRKQGGSVYVGQTSTNTEVDMDGVPFPSQGRKQEWQSVLAQELQKEMAVFKNRYSNIALKPKDVFQIEIHDTGTDRGIIDGGDETCQWMYVH